MNDSFGDRDRTQFGKPEGIFINCCQTIVKFNACQARFCKYLVTYLYQVRWSLDRFQLLTSSKKVFSKSVYLSCLLFTIIAVYFFIITYIDNIIIKVNICISTINNRCI